MLRHSVTVLRIHRTSVLFALADSIDRIGTHYDPDSFTSKDVPAGPTKSNQPHDPVFANHKAKLTLGPLKRKMNYNSDNYMDTTETEKWMEVKQAAKILGIKEEELSTLTSGQIEEKWAAAYAPKTYSQQQETVLAAEVLLEYLDSNTYKRKSKDFYRNYIENARQAIDNEQVRRREGYKDKFLLFSAVMVTGGCMVILLVAYLKGAIDRDQFKEIGANASQFVNVSFMQPRNVEPAPDYGTRYHNTPSSLELDRLNGDSERRLMNPALALALKDKEEYDQKEDMLTIQLINMENERIRREKKETALMESTVFIHRKEDYDPETGAYVGPKAKPAAAQVDEPMRAPSLAEYFSLLQSQLGGSRVQRMVGGTLERGRQQDEVKNRLRMVDPAAYEAQWGAPAADSATNSSAISDLVTAASAKN